MSFTAQLQARIHSEYMGTHVDSEIEKFCEYVIKNMDGYDSMYIAFVRKPKNSGKIVYYTNTDVYDRVDFIKAFKIKLVDMRMRITEHDDAEGKYRIHARWANLSLSFVCK